MKFDTIIRRGSLVTSAGVATADLAIVGESIAAIGPDLAGQATTEIDAAGLQIFAGMIDPHLHFNEPGRTEWEGAATGSAALAAGGGTCYFDMPLNSSPPTLDGPGFDLKHAALAANSLTDFALWGGLTPGNIDRLEELAERGVIGFKAFMCGSGIEDFLASDDFTLWRGMQIAARLKLPVGVHAENDSITQRLTREAIDSNRTSVRDYLNSRPVIAELEAISRAIMLAKDTGCSLHIVHVSTGRGVALVTEARARGIDVTCETCPHYLVLTDEDVERLGAVAKCSPPIRSLADQQELWQALLEGQIAFVGSDHSPSPPSMKESQNFFQIWGGISGVQVTLGHMLQAGCLERGLPLERIAMLTSNAVAERFHISKKGRLEVGCDADLALVDLAASVELEQSDLHDRHRLSPYLGMRLGGRVVRTLLRGNTIFAGGKHVCGVPAKLVRPE